jgi:hypothetical protein
MTLMTSAQKRYVLEQAVDTVAAIAEIAGKKFTPVRDRDAGSASTDVPLTHGCCYCCRSAVLWQVYAYPGQHAGAR